jgi:hypothetical protein
MTSHLWLPRSTRRGQGRSDLSETMTDDTPRRSSALSAVERATGIEGSRPGTEVDDLLFTRTIGRSEATNAGSALAEANRDRPFVRWGHRKSAPVG